jgi:hypothetical protein
VHYPDEPYVRKYPRKTLTWHKLGWEGRAVKDAMLGEFDRAGIFDLDGDDAAECIALVTGIPIEFVRVGLERLLKRKTWTRTEGALVWRNYVWAQTCAKSDKLRQAESRARRAEEASGEPPSDGDVTTRHDPSRNVTPNLAQPNPTDLSSERERDDRQSDPEVEPQRRPRRRRRPRSFWQFPEGWKWSPATAAKAAAAGVTERELVAHVDYWTIHIWPVEVTDLDGELVRAFDGIKARRAKASTEPASNPYAWAPTAEHRTFASSKGLPLQIAVDAYRAGGLPDKLGTLVAHDDFLRRLRCWAATGEFHATGPLPKPLRETARGAA